MATVAAGLVKDLREKTGAGSRVPRYAAPFHRRILCGS